MHYVKDKGERVQRRRGGWAKGRTGKGREKKKKTRTTHNRNVGGHGCRCSPQRPLPSVKRLLLPLIGPADILTLRGVSSRVPPLPHPGTQRESTMLHAAMGGGGVAVAARATTTRSTTILWFKLGFDSKRTLFSHPTVSLALSLSASRLVPPVEHTLGRTPPAPSLPGPNPGRPFITFNSSTGKRPRS